MSGAYVFPSDDVCKKILVLYMKQLCLRMNELEPATRNEYRKYKKYMLELTGTDSNQLTNLYKTYQTSFKRQIWLKNHVFQSNFTHKPYKTNKTKFFELFWVNFMFLTWFGSFIMLEKLKFHQNYTRFHEFRSKSLKNLKNTEKTW